MSSKIPEVDDRISVGEKTYIVVRVSKHDGAPVLHLKDASVNSPIPGWGVVAFKLVDDFLVPVKG